MDWGDVPTWIGSISTLLALGAAVLAARASFRMLKIENRRDAIAERRSESAQAERVAGWVDRTQDRDNIEGAVSARLGDGSVWRVLVVNRSDLPIYDVQISSVTPSGLTVGESETHGILPPGNTTFELPPRDNQEPATDSVADDELRIALHFKDAAGFGWTRLADGSLMPDLPFDDPARLGGETPATPLENDHGASGRWLRFGRLGQKKTRRPT